MNAEIHSDSSASPLPVPWTLELFGGLRARRESENGQDHIVETFRTQKTGALLAFLSLDRRLHSREWLAELFWPDVPIDSARNSLRVSLSWLRAVLEEPPLLHGRVLRSTRDGIGAGELLKSDLDKFHAHIKRAEGQKSESARLDALEAALALVPGPLLRGFYDDWAIGAARRFESEYLEIARRVIAAREIRRDWLRALGVARHAAMIVPDSDGPMRDLVRLGAKAGESASVKREFQAWKKRRQNSGLAASPEWDDFVPAPVLPCLELEEETIATQGTVPPQLNGTQGALRPRELPVALSSFVGRAKERARLGALLRQDEVRLVTILGAGGAGKTRLALEAAQSAKASGDFASVAWVAGASLNTLRAVQNALFESLGLSCNDESLDVLAGALEDVDGRVLLVLDNIEHLGEAGARWLGELLARAPRAVILATSRVAIRSVGERLWVLAPLFSGASDASDEQTLADADEPDEWPDAVRLFVERAQLVRPEFEPTAPDLESIARACRALDGSPLAIEIAAARLALFSPDQLARQLEHDRAPRAPFSLAPDKSNSLLDWHNRDLNAPARHRTLREAIEWSARQLPPLARRFWVRLSAFQGAFSVEAAMFVGEEPGAAPLLLSLRDSSLLSLETAGETPRARWNEALREFALELLSSQERAEIQARHAAWFARRACEWNRAPEQLSTKDREKARLELLESSADWESAFEWFLAHDSQVALEMGADLAPLWDAGGRLAQGRALLARALSATSSVLEEVDEAWSLRARALESAARLARRAFDFPNARSLLESARESFERAGDAEGAARALAALGRAALRHGDVERANALSEQSQSLDKSKTKPDALFNFSLVASMQGDFETLRALSSEALALYRAQGNRHGIALCLENLGLAALLSGELPSALVYYNAARDTFESLGENAGAARTLWGLGHIRRLEGDFVRARECFERAFELSGAPDNKWALCYLLEAFALLAGSVQNLPLATRLLAGARRARREESIPLPRPYFGAELDELQARCQSELGAARFEAEHTVSESLSRDELVSLAREPLN